MVLETYLKHNNSNFHLMHLRSGIPETTIRGINRRQIEKWNIEYFDAIAKAVNKDRFTVINELESLNDDLKARCQEQILPLNGRYNLENRRYIGSKSRLLSWISDLLELHSTGSSFFDVFAGTGIVTKGLLEKYDNFIINDFLFSNEVIYEAFFGEQSYDASKLLLIQNSFQNIDKTIIDDDYFEKSYGGKFFSVSDARLIGEIRNRIEAEGNLNSRERSILIASLIYSADKVANTVGHYDAYRKKANIEDRFIFELINPVDTSGKKIEIFREDSNSLARMVSADIAFIDPPYNSRQYSRFYHVLEGIAKWDKPELEGVAMKPPAENISEYSKVCAPEVFDDLVKNLDVNYIAVTYNNTYKSKSSSSRNKITHDEILKSLESVGTTSSFEMPYHFFNAGKSELRDHKEFLFITKVGE